MRTRNRNTAIQANEQRVAYDIMRELLKHPRLRYKLLRKKRPAHVEFRVILEEDTGKEVIEVKPVVKKKLTKAEKRELHKRISGSANLFSKKGVEESLRIANREDWED